MAGHTSLHIPVPEQILDHHRAVLVPAAWDGSFPCLHPAERKNSLIRGKYKHCVAWGQQQDFWKPGNGGPILCQKVTFRGTLRMLIHPPGPLCLCPPAPHSHGGYLMLCLSSKWGKEAGALPIIFGPQLQAMAQLPLLSVSLEQGQRFASRGKGG